MQTHANVVYHILFVYHLEPHGRFRADYFIYAVVLANVVVTAVSEYRFYAVAAKRFCKCYEMVAFITCFACYFMLRKVLTAKPEVYYGI